MRALVAIPTYNERENIGDLLRAVLTAAPDVDVLVIDDASPDGTADEVEKIAAELGQIDLMRRAKKDGLGNAYRAGFARGLRAGYEVLVTFDADFSHEPESIGPLLAELTDGVDLVVGSRYVAGGSTPSWPAHRRLLSRWGNRYTGWILGLDVRDITSGFRAYRASTLEAISVETTEANGYAFMTELAFRISSRGGTVREVPITFRDRERGTSKMSTQIIAESMARVTLWGLTLRAGRVLARLRR